MTITGQSSLNKDDIERMVKDAESHAEEDRKRRDEAEVRNQADTLVYQTEKLLREQGDKVDATEREQVEAKLADLKAVKDGEDVEAIKDAVDALVAVSQSFAQKLYDAANQSNGAEAGPSATAAPDDDEVVDAEIVDES
jgi:molecular chaperone DnaK